MAVSFTVGGALRGARAVLPLMPGAAAFGLLYGYLAAQKGMGPVEVGLSSGLVFAGASQLLALELWSHPLPAVTILIGVLVINLRHLLMGPVLMPWLGPLGGWRGYGSLYLMTDESWGASVADMRRGGSDAAFLPGAGMTLWLVWVACSVAGTFAGDVSGFVHDWGLEFLSTAFFVALLAGFWRGHGDLVPWLVAVIVAILAKMAFGPGWSVLAGALAGSLLAAWRDVRRTG
ncbi:MAG: AzlC family ABC transporter permease [Geminicoccaceae bacterium]